MQKITLIDKSSLDKINIGSNIIKLNKVMIIQPNIKKEEILEIIQDGNHLIIKLKNGETITIENYFVKAADGATSDLVFDGTVCAFEQLFWQDGVASFKEITGLEELLPIITGTSTGGVGPLPWVVGGLVTGGIIAATDDDKSDSEPKNEPTFVLKAPKVEILDDQNNDGFLSNIEIGNKDQVGVIVSIPIGAKAGDTITVTDQSGKKYTHVLVSEDLNSGTVTIQVDRPTEGNELKVTATITNQEGESEPSPEDSAVIKTTPPILTVEVPEKSNDTTPTITGKTDVPAGSKIELTITDKNGNTQIVTTEVKDDGTYTVDVPDALPEGEFTVTGKVTDSIGNSTTATDQGTIDTTSPKVKIDITQEGEITVTFDPDVDPSSITPDDFKITDKDGNPIEITLTPSEDG
ncbi:hypothetical protein A7P53_12565, partial [Acinetobacter defluvii]|uniref:BapA/Bap/LapF family prefix-like domain-containing protein n=1 Tax=Acinetobacter defluvii TaxID=1871111 RepID=UPI00149063B4